MEIVGNESVLVPTWKKCPKCGCNEVIVEEIGNYSEIHNYGNLIERNIVFEKLGPTITTCYKCGNALEEDVN